MLTQLKKFTVFAKMMGYEIIEKQLENELIVYFNDEQKAPYVETIGYDKIHFLGVFDSDGEAIKLFNVSHVDIDKMPSEFVSAIEKLDEPEVLSDFASFSW